jgi:hypothetical protein
MSTPSVGKAADDGADDDAADNASFAGADTESRLHPRLLSPYYFRARRDLNRLLTITIVVLGLCAIVLYFHFTHTLDYSSLFKHFALPFVVLILIILTVFWLIQISSRVTEVRFDFAANQIRESVVEQSKELQQSRPEYRDIELDRYHHGEDGSSVNFTYGDIAASSSIDRQEAILLEMYTQGLTQAKLSFRTSIIFIGVGSSLLLFGIFLAIINAPGTGKIYASVVALCAGVVTNVASTVFFVQSNRARTDMAKQATLLREEGQEDRRLSAARDLTASISDAGLRDDIRAKLALKLLIIPTDDIGPATGGMANDRQSRIENGPSTHSR